MEHRYTLEKYKNLSSRHLCPKCGKKELTFYIDTETNGPIHPTVGRCNRESNCSYNYTPKQYFTDNNIFADTSPPVATKMTPLKPEPKQISYIDFDIFKQSLANYENNNFIKFLTSTFGENITDDLIKKYNIGTSTHWEGSTVFFQMDNDNKIRAGKVMLYETHTGKRIKVPFDHITWLHSLMKSEMFNLSQCLFGLHLIKGNLKPIAICESEKTSIIASVYLPQFIWLATGGKNNMRADLFTNLQNRKVVFFPDLKCFDLWSEKANTFGLSNYTISDLLERKASDADKIKGLDLVDYLLKYDYQKCRLKELIRMQWQKLTPECWDLTKEYDLNTLVEYINTNFNLNVNPVEYLQAYNLLNFTNNK